jgi:SAM-dependent methyltransferase
MPDPIPNSTEHDWEEQARDWVAWARRPDHDSYWRYRDGFFDLVPEPGKATLDLGCGEGRVSRDLAERGHNVTGVDVSPTLIAAAAEADLDGGYFDSKQARHVEERDGLRMRFSGWTRPLGAYTAALEQAGLLIEAIREPVARRADGTELDIPYHLWLRALCPVW